MKSAFTTGHFELIATYAHIIIWCAPGVSRSPTSMTRISNQFSCANLCRAVFACRDMQLKFWGCARSVALGPKLILKSNVINIGEGNNARSWREKFPNYSLTATVSTDKNLEKAFKTITSDDYEGKWKI